jgi:hypothetical protein
MLRTKLAAANSLGKLAAANSRGKLKERGEVSSQVKSRAVNSARWRGAHWSAAA